MCETCFYGNVPGVGKILFMIYLSPWPVENSEVLITEIKAENSEHNHLSLASSQYRSSL